jgi:predicted enzyme related to lactoylglutathione lyase
MATLQLQNVYVTATNVTALSTFYERALGLKLKFADAERWHQFKLANTSLAVSSEDESALAAGTGFLPVFETVDLGATVESVVSAGGSHVNTRDMGAHGKVATVRDLEGNAFQLFQRVPQ